LPITAISKISTPLSGFQASFPHQVWPLLIRSSTICEKNSACDAKNAQIWNFSDALKSFFGRVPPGPAGRAYSAPPDLLAGNGKEREGRKEGREGSLDQ